MTADEDIDEVLRGAMAFELVDEVPRAVRSALLEVAWDRDRLLRVQHHAIQIRIAELDRYLSLPLWRDPAGCPFRTTPVAVMADPGRHAGHASRIERADLRVPIHVVRRHGLWLILDGVHRLAKAHLRRKTHIAAVELSARDLAAIIVSD